MKKLICLFLAAVAMVGCQPKSEPAPETPKDDPAKIAYEQNLATTKAALKAFENENLDEFGSYVSDSVVVLPATYGSKESNKEEWKSLLGYFTSEFDSIRLTQSIFLPGIDSATHEPDGSVRYYGTWVSRHKSGMNTSVRFYAAYEFDDNHKILFAQDFFDVGGLLNAVAPKKK